jgi:hypothetical protein
LGNKMFVLLNIAFFLGTFILLQLKLKACMQQK